jgi:hypothetical protein
VVFKNSYCKMCWEQVIDTCDDIYEYLKTTKRECIPDIISGCDRLGVSIL